MEDRVIKIPIKKNPVLLDKIIQDIQTKLKEKLTWLDYAFGRAYKLVQHQDNGGKFIYPAAYIGNSDYISLLPDDNYGNFCWFDIYDSQKVINVVQSTPQFTISGAIIFWFNLDSIFSDNDAMYTEEIKDEIIRVLSTPGIVKQTGKLAINEIYERFENIYSGYSIEKIYNSYQYSGQDIQSLDKMFFMHPYSGLRFEFTITTRELCQRYIK
jgi:hypothetical protein|nr:MAG TPA: hypothetical protein [Caudoviricetes sp.]